MIQRDENCAETEPIGTQRTETDWNSFDLDEPNGKAKAKTGIEPELIRIALNRNGRASIRTAKIRNSLADRCNGDAGRGTATRRI